MSKIDIDNEFILDLPNNELAASRAELPSDPNASDTNNIFASEDHLITTLRDQDTMSWADIASIINTERTKRHQPRDMTVAAVYSRYVLATSVTAKPVNEIGFHAKDFEVLRQPAPGSTGRSAGAVSRIGNKRVKNLDNAKELAANIRSVVGDGDQELMTKQRTEQLLDAVGRVERGFWRFVADEMERSTARLWEADVLEKRYRDIQGAVDGGDGDEVSDAT